MNILVQAAAILRDTEGLRLKSKRNIMEKLENGDRKYSHLPVLQEVKEKS